MMTSSRSVEPRAALHSVIGDELRARVTDGRLPIGAALPSEAELCREFSVSRGPVRQALAALRAEGIIAGSKGAVARVVGSVPTQSMTNFLSFSEWAHSTNRQPGQRTVELAKRPANDEVAAALSVAGGEPVVEVLRLRLLDGVPVMVERTSFRLDAGRHLFDFDTDSGSIFAHLKSQGVELVAAQHTFDAIAAESLDAQLLEVPEGSPLLRERRVTSTGSGVPVEYSDDHYVPEQVRFTINNTAGTGSSAIRLVPEPGNPLHTD